MPIRKCLFFTSLGVLSLLPGGCGLYTPVMDLDNDPNVTAYIAGKIVGHVKCELGRAILDEIKYDIDNAKQNNFPRHLKWLDSAAGTLTITMQVNEKSSINPSVSWIDPVSKLSSFSLAVGAGLSAEATRKQQTDYRFDVKRDFLGEKDKRRYDSTQRSGNCEPDDAVQIEGNLRIGEWLHSSLFPFDVPNYVDEKEPDVLTDDITFVATLSGNGVAGSKLYRVNVNPSAPLASASRARTNEALIALGPVKPSKNSRKAVSPSQTVLDFRNIALIGSSLNLSLRTP